MSERLDTHLVAQPLQLGAPGGDQLTFVLDLFLSFV
jgi:hypothetical protein